MPRVTQTTLEHFDRMVKMGLKPFVLQNNDTVVLTLEQEEKHYITLVPNLSLLIKESKLFNLHEYIFRLLEETRRGKAAT